jgi:hypothetical protein
MQVLECNELTTGVQAEKRLVAEYQSKVETLQEKIAGLEASLGQKEEELNALKASGSGGENVGSCHRNLGAWLTKHVGHERQTAGMGRAADKPGRAIG